MSYKREAYGNVKQLSLGELIELIKPIIAKAEEGDEITVGFDFGYATPDFMCSWRGSYEELSIVFHDEPKDVSTQDFLEMLQSAIGKQFTGWKGGEFTMTENTPLWVSKPEHGADTAVVGVFDGGYKIVIITAYCEF